MIISAYRVGVQILLAKGYGFDYRLFPANLVRSSAKALNQ